MSKLRRPWRYTNILDYFSDSSSAVIVLGWQLRLEILEKIAKQLSGLHRKKLAYGTLSARVVYVESVTQYGIEAKDDYLIPGGPLEDVSAEALRRRDAAQALDNLAFGVLALQMVTEKPLNRRLLPQLFKLLERRGLEVDYVTTIDIDDLESVDENYEHDLLAKEKNFRENTTTQAQEETKALPKKTSSKLNVLKKAAQTFVKATTTMKKKELAESIEADEYALASVIKDEVNMYLSNHMSGGKDVEKPIWMLNLEEMIADCLTSVEESRPTASVIRTWLIEALTSYKKLAEVALAKPDVLLEDVDYLYEIIDMNIILRLVDREKDDVFIYHSTETNGYDDDLESLDSFMPPEEVGTLLKKSGEDQENEKELKESDNEDDELETSEFKDNVTAPINVDLQGVSILDAKAKRALDEMTNQLNAMGAVLPSKTVGAKFDEQNKLAHDEAVNLLKRARKVLAEEKNILVLDAPVTVIGDLHGQYFDLRQIMRIIGKPKQRRSSVLFGMTRKRQKKIVEELGVGAADPNAAFQGTQDDGKTFLFLGDYVDRGAWSCEVLFYVLSLKVEYPNSVFLLRGNHECDAMGTQYGFRAECEFKYGREVYHRCLELFKAMPIACIINLPNRRRFLACHGGISDKITTLQDIATTNRFREPGLEGILCDLVWSDPVDNDIEQPGIDFEQIEFVPNQDRGCGKKFGYLALEKFLKTNKLAGIIRAHQAIEEGFHFHFQNHGTRDHLVTTVFSAPNYLNECGNKGAVMVVHKSVEERVRIQTARYHGRFSAEQLLYSDDQDKDDAVNFLEPICYTEVAQPEVSAAAESEDNNITKQIVEACPYMPITLRDFFESTLDLLDRFGDARMQLLSHHQEEESSGKKKKQKLTSAKRRAALASGKAKFKRAKLKLKVIYILKKNARRAARRRKRQAKLARRAVERNALNEMHPQVAKEKALKASRKLEMMESDAREGNPLVRENSMQFQTTLDLRSRASIKRVLAGRTIERFKAPSFASQSSFDSFAGKSNSDLRIFYEKLQSTTASARDQVQIEHLEKWKHILANWFSDTTGRRVRVSNFCRDIEDGIVLCEMIQYIDPSISIIYTKPKPTVKLDTVEKRGNLFAFFDACRKVNITSSFFMMDLKTDSFNFVLPCLIELAVLGKSKRLLKGQLPREKFLEEGRQNNTELEVGNVVFSVREQTMLQLLFLIMDRDDSGSVDFQELEAWADEEGLILDKEDALLCISAIDYDQDTTIGLSDFFQFAAKLKELYETEDLITYDYEDLDPIETPGGGVMFEGQLYEDFDFDSDEFEDDEYEYEPIDDEV